MTENNICTWYFFFKDHINKELVGCSLKKKAHFPISFSKLFSFLKHDYWSLGILGQGTTDKLTVSLMMINPWSLVTPTVNLPLCGLWNPPLPLHNYKLSLGPESGDMLHSAM